MKATIFATILVMFVTFATFAATVEIQYGADGMPINTGGINPEMPSGEVPEFMMNPDLPNNGMPMPLPKKPAPQIEYGADGMPVTFDLPNGGMPVIEMPQPQCTVIPQTIGILSDWGGGGTHPTVPEPSLAIAAFTAMVIMKKKR